MSFLAKQDPNVKAVIDQELMRQRDKLEMMYNHILGLKLTLLYILLC